MSPSPQCPICWDDYSPQTSPGGSPPSTSPRHALPCGHVFHEHCVRRWLDTHDACPLCRQKVDGFETQTTQTAMAEPAGLSGALLKGLVVTGIVLAGVFVAQRAFRGSRNARH